MDARLLREVNCESCDHLLYITNRHGEEVGFGCESDMEPVELTEVCPLHELTCHSLYELYLDWREGLCDE